MFAKRRANVCNLGFCAFYKHFVRRAREVLSSPPFANIFPLERNPYGLSL